jgi:hypothetical protein
MARVACHLADMHRDFDESVPTAARLAARLECVQVGFRMPTAFVNTRSHKRTWSSGGRHSGGRTGGRGGRASGSHARTSRASSSLMHHTLVGGTLSRHSNPPKASGTGFRLPAPTPKAVEVTLL